jgi:hypothetical protein
VRRMNKLSLIATTAAISTGGAFAVDAAFTSAHGGAFHHHGMHRAHGGVIHAEFVVPGRDDTFKTITTDRGTITGVDGSTIHLREGTRTATYKTVDITLGDDAVVRVDGHAASVSDLKADQRAKVTRLPKRTFVNAFNRR